MKEKETENKTGISNWIDERLPVFTFINHNLRDYPTDTEASSPLGPFTITSSTDKVDTRARSRFANLKIANTSTDENWRYGTFRADIQPDGMRG